MSPIAASEVAIAGRSSKPAARIISGTATIPPPTPKSALKSPAVTPIRARRSTGPMLRRGGVGSDSAARERPGGGGALPRHRRRPRADRRGPGRLVRARGDPRRAAPPGRELRSRRLRHRPPLEAGARDRRRRGAALRRRARAGARAGGGGVGRAATRVRRRSGLAGRAGQAADGVLPLPHAPRPRTGTGRARAGRGERAGRGVPGALGADGAGGRAAGRREQGHRGAAAARRDGTAARALRGRRHDRPGRLPRARRPRAVGAGRGRVGRGAGRARPARRRRRPGAGGAGRASAAPVVHVDETVLAPLRARYGEPVRLSWEGEISEVEHGLVTYDPRRMHDVTFFVVSGQRIVLIRKPMFEPGIWRPPGGGVKPGEPFEAGVEREALEETGLRIRLRRYLVDAT